ncbi:MAG: GTP 3',8-cyclase MoaA [Acidobacteria bacterium]|nr:GTP 3',8-cyclase MoaA [Acidobacteriota bacterium]
MTTVRDALDRPLRSLRISVTDRCNLRCQYCMPEEEYVWLPRRDILTFEETGALVDAFTDAGVDRVRLTGGEPLLRTNLPHLIRLLAGRPALRDLALTTNGMLLADQAAALRTAGLHRLTVSLDTLRADRFRDLTRFDGLAAVRAGIAAAAEAGFTGLKLDTVVIRGVNDDELLELLSYAASVDAEVRFIEYMDVGGATRWSTRDVVSRAEMLRVIGDARGPVAAIDEQTSAPADRFRLPDGQTFGIISSTTEPFCRTCDRSRLTADGLWYRCLYARTGTDLRQPLRAGASRAELGDFIGTIWSERRDRGAELRLEAGDRQPLIPIETLQREPHLEMHTRGG